LESITRGEYLTRNSTEILFINHSSLLVKYYNQESESRYLLLDPWHTKPAFGSWLPNFHQYVSPTYIAALGNKLTILISHAHDDHCDDELLALFDKETQIVTAKFQSGSVKRRMEALGFANILECTEEGLQLESLQINSFINREISFDDALYSISLTDSLIIHANDNWFQLSESIKSHLKDKISKVGESRTFYFTQTNSASGFPFTYPQYSQNVDRVLLAKVSKMIRSGMINASNLGLDKLYSYAGFANVYIKDLSYASLFTTSKFVNNIAIPFIEKLVDSPRDLTERVRIEEIYPGDVITIEPLGIRKAFVSSDDYSDNDILKKGRDYFETYKLLESCDTWKYTDGLVDKLHLQYFLNGLQEFAAQLIARQPSFKTLAGKSFEIYCQTSKHRVRIGFGGDFSPEQLPNKRLEVDDALMSAVLRGDVLFENLYTGYEGTWYRFPKEVYNRDIILTLVMYSYKYKNLLSKSYPGVKKLD
jgi:hypothetical protein